MKVPHVQKGDDHNLALLANMETLLVGNIVCGENRQCRDELLFQSAEVVIEAGMVARLLGRVQLDD